MSTLSARAYDGPPLFSYGFRPFFLGASLFAGLAVALWLPAYFGELTLPTAYPALYWHIHEMIYGYGAAAVAGFTLTAIPNWTGGLPLQGGKLIALSGLWLAGRLAMAFSALIGAVPAAAVDLAFLALLIVFVARELGHGGQSHNRKVAAALAVLWLGDLVFHVEAIAQGYANYGVRIGLAALLLLITLIGGRIIPSFTRNWLARMNPGALPAPADRWDVAAIVLRRSRSRAGSPRRTPRPPAGRSSPPVSRRRRGWRAGAAGGPGATGWCWSSTSPICSCRSASC